MWRSVVLWLCLFASWTLSAGLGSSSLEPTLETNIELLSLILKIKTERYFELLFLLDCFEEDAIIRKLNMPQILLGNNNSHAYLRPQFSSEMLAVACLPQHGSLQVLDSLAAALNHMRYVRIVLVVKSGWHQLGSLLRYCQKLKFINIIAINPELLTRTGQYRSFKMFPAFKVTKKDFNRTKTIYHDQFKNMHGYAIRTYADQTWPRTIIYRYKGRLHFGGYVGRMLGNMARKRNATFSFPLGYSRQPILFDEVVNFTRSDTVDIPMGFVANSNRSNQYEYSYPMESLDWCLMQPIEDYSRAEIFFRSMLLESSISLVTLLAIHLIAPIMMLSKYFSNVANSCRARLNWLDLVISDKAIQGSLGMSFTYGTKEITCSVRLVLIALFLLGFINVTTYHALLQSYMMQAPTKPALKSYKEISAAGMRIMQGRGEFELMRGAVPAEYQSLFVPTSMYDFYDHVDNFNTSYSYMVASNRWFVFERQQEMFARKIFRRSTDMCFSKFIHCSLVLHENSIFSQIVNEELLERATQGFHIQSWHTAYQELVVAGHIPFKDLSRPKGKEPLQVGDLKWIFIIFICGIFISSISFLLELLWYWMRNRAKK